MNKEEREFFFLILDMRANIKLQYIMNFCLQLDVFAVWHSSELEKSYRNKQEFLLFLLFPENPTS